ncbi:hypothetical protein D3C72_1525290 [compost metagenome]
MAGQKLKLINDSLAVSDNQLKAQTLSLRAGKSSSKSYLDAKMDLLKLQRTKLLLEQEIEVLKKKIQRWFPSSAEVAISSLDLLDVEDISKSIEAQKVSEQSLSGKLAKEEIQEMDQELQIVRGRENNGLKVLTSLR